MSPPQPAAQRTDAAAEAEAGAARQPGQLPRVPSTRLARLAVWSALVALAAFWRYGADRAAPAAGGSAHWQVSRAAHGCELQPPGRGEPCPCAEWPARVRLVLGQPLPLNRATQRDLELLPGIGPALAAAIVRERAQGPFARVEDIGRVPGIGPGMIARLAPLLTTGEPTCPLGR